MLHKDEIIRCYAPYIGRIRLTRRKSNYYRVSNLPRELLVRKASKKRFSNAISLFNRSKMLIILHFFLLLWNKNFSNFGFRTIIFIFNLLFSNFLATSRDIYLLFSLQPGNYVFQGEFFEFGGSLFFFKERNLNYESTTFDGSRKYKFRSIDRPAFYSSS